MEELLLVQQCLDNALPDPTLEVKSAWQEAGAIAGEFIGAGNRVFFYELTATHAIVRGKPYLMTPSAQQLLFALSGKLRTDSKRAVCKKGKPCKTKAGNIICIPKGNECASDKRTSLKSSSEKEKESSQDLPPQTAGDTFKKVAFAIAKAALVFTVSVQVAAIATIVAYDDQKEAMRSEIDAQDKGFAYAREDLEKGRAQATSQEEIDDYDFEIKEVNEYLQNGINYVKKAADSLDKSIEELRKDRSIGNLINVNIESLRLHAIGIMYGGMAGYAETKREKREQELGRPNVATRTTRVAYARAQNEKVAPPRSRTTEGRDPYEVLGVSKDASAEEVKKAYIKKMRQYHPDLVTQFSEKEQQEFKRISQELNEAREILDAVLRKKAKKPKAKEAKPKTQSNAGRFLTGSRGDSLELHRTRMDKIKAICKKGKPCKTESGNVICIPKRSQCASDRLKQAGFKSANESENTNKKTSGFLDKAIKIVAAVALIAGVAAVVEEGDRRNRLAHIFNAFDDFNSGLRDIEFDVQAANVDARDIYNNLLQERDGINDPNDLEDIDISIEKTKEFISISNDWSDAYLSAKQAASRFEDNPNWENINDLEKEVYNFSMKTAEFQAKANQLDQDFSESQARRQARQYARNSEERIPRTKTTSGKDPYETLGVKPGASDEEIKKAYLKKIQQYHPDKMENASAKDKEDALKQAQDINEARDSLRDLERRNRRKDSLVIHRLRMDAISKACKGKKRKKQKQMNDADALYARSDNIRTNALPGKKGKKCLGGYTIPANKNCRQTSMTPSVQAKGAKVKSSMAESGDGRLAMAGRLIAGGAIAASALLPSSNHERR